MRIFAELEKRHGDGHRVDDSEHDGERRVRDDLSVAADKGRGGVWNEADGECDPQLVRRSRWLRLRGRARV